MSRLIIKGLPIRFDDKRLRELFSSSGEVTDAKVIKTKDGRSRQFGFIGFRSKEEAKSARNRLNRSYVDTNKVIVEFAHAMGDRSIPRPWSKYSEGSSRYEKLNIKSSENERKEFLSKEAQRLDHIRQTKQLQNDAESLKDESLAEFQDVAGRAAKNPIWANGGQGVMQKSTLVPSRKTGGEGKLLERKHVTFADDGSESENDDLYEELPTTTASDEIQDKDTETGTTSDPIALDAGVSDMDYFKSKVVKETGEAEKTTAESDNEAADKEESESEPDDALEEAASTRKDEDNAGNDQKDDTVKKCEPVSQYELRRRQSAKLHKDVDAGDTGRLLVRNLAFSTTEDDLETLFEPFGVLADVHIVRDSSTGKSRGIAFVQYVIHENAPKAIAAVDGNFHSGRILHILPAKPRPTAESQGKNYSASTSDPGSSTFKSEREEARREAARNGLDGKAQNAMHMSADAVAGIVTDRHGVSKSILFGTEKGESGIAAVRLAMAEASIQGETRQFLLDHGVDLEEAVRVAAEANANTQAAKRKRKSRTSFLVKNLPARTVYSDLEDMFTKFGVLSRLVVVPSGLLAVVEYLNSSDAKRAYNSLAYTKFRSTPLYFEWLPTEALKPVDVNSTLGAEQIEQAKQENAQAKEIEKAPESATPSQTVHIYVKNLNFDTNDETLKSHFMKVLKSRPEVRSSLRSAKVAMKRGAQSGTENLSMGFGFVEFASHEHAAEAVKLAQNSLLDGHTLQLRLSNQSDGAESSKKRKKPSKSSAKASSKLIVKNIAFEATRRDLRQLFSAFGQLKNVRLPQKMDGSHRGFGFVEFISKGEAKAAFDALSATHLYGRHLVIEYAEEASETYTSIGELQERAAMQVSKKRLRTTDGSGERLENGNEGSDDEVMMRDTLYGA